MISPEEKFRAGQLKLLADFAFLKTAAHALLRKLLRIFLLEFRLEFRPDVISGCFRGIQLRGMEQVRGIDPAGKGYCHPVVFRKEICKFQVFFL